MNQIRRINFFAGPCNGKSTVSADVYAQFKKQHKNVELVREYVKSWTYHKRKIESFDQLYIFAHQMHQEDIALRSGVDFIITDCPVSLGIVYCKFYGLNGWKGLEIIEKDFEKKYPSLNILLLRDPKQVYSELGRFQSKEEAIEVDKQIVTILDEMKRRYIGFYPCQHDEILKYISKHV